ncbi:MAG: MFS transporter [Spirochaetales bacterium]|nr:MFS transporter [Spirochaetales bacterium]
MITALIFQVYLPAFLMHVGLSMTIPVIPLFARDLGASLGAIGLIVATKGIGPILLNIPSGMLISKYGNRFILLVTTVLTILTAVGTGLTRNIAVLALMTLLMGGAQTVWQLTRVNYVRTTVPAGQRGRAIASLGGIGRIAGLLGPIVGGLIGKFVGLKWVFFAQGLISLLVLAQLLASKKTKEIHVPAAGTTSRGLSTVIEMLGTHKKSFLTFGIVSVVFHILRIGRHVLFPLWGEAIGLDVAEIGLILGLISAVDMTLFYPAGMIMDRKGRKWAAIPSLLIMSASFCLLPLAGSFAVLLVVGLLNGFGNGLGSGIVMTMGSDLAPKDHAGEFLGIWFLVSAIGDLVGPAVIGYISQLLTLGAGSVSVGGIGFAGTAFMLFFVADTLRKRKEPDPPPAVTKPTE